MRALTSVALSLALGGLLCAQVMPPSPLERLARGSAEVCRPRGCEETRRVRLPGRARIVARVIARRDPEFLGTPMRAWRLVIETPGGVWARPEPLGEHATICNELEHITFAFALRAMELRDVAGGTEPELALVWLDSRSPGTSTFAMACDLTSATPRCSDTVAVAGTVDEIFATHDTIHGAVGDVPITLR